jgi:hypothetical protein
MVYRPTQLELHGFNATVAYAPSSTCSVKYIFG